MMVLLKYICFCEDDEMTVITRNGERHGNDHFACEYSQQFLHNALLFHPTLCRPGDKSNYTVFRIIFMLTIYALCIWSKITWNMMLFLCVECDALIQAKPKPAQLFQQPNLKDVFDSGTFRLTRAHMKYCSVHAQPFYSHFTRLAYVDKLHFNLYTIVFLFVAFIVIFTLNKCEAGKKVGTNTTMKSAMCQSRERVCKPVK